jgi:hypothetical protein
MIYGKNELELIKKKDDYLVPNGAQKSELD